MLLSSISIPKVTPVYDGRVLEDAFRLPSGHKVGDLQTEAKRTSKQGSIRYREALNTLASDWWHFGLSELSDRMFYRTWHRPVRDKSTLLEALRAQYSAWDDCRGTQGSLYTLLPPWLASSITVDLSDPETQQRFPYWVGDLAQFGAHVNTHLNNINSVPNPDALFVAQMLILFDQERFSYVFEWFKKFTWVVIVPFDFGIGIWPVPYAPTWGQAAAMHMNYRQAEYWRREALDQGETYEANPIETQSLWRFTPGASPWSNLSEVTSV